MSCNCQENNVGNTQQNLVAWIQPGGASPRHDVVYAMTEGDWPGVKITGARLNRRGAITPIYNRSGVNPRLSVRAGSRVAAPAANAITLEFSGQGCGGYMPNELVSCELDVYNQHICCDEGGEFARGWSRIDVFTGIDIESDEYSDLTSYDSEDSARLFIRHAAEFKSKLTIYPLNFGELAAAAGLDTGTRLNSATYLNRERCVTSPCPGIPQNCAEQWYAVTNEGTVIYRRPGETTMQSVAIAGYQANSSAHVAVLGDRIFVTFVDSGGGAPRGYYWATLDSDGDPGTWTKVTVSTSFTPQGWFEQPNRLILFGSNGATGASVYEVNRDATFTALLGSLTAATGIFDVAGCGATLLGVGDNGAIWLSSCQNTWSLSTTSPTVQDIFTVGLRPPGEWWIGTTDAHVFYSNDNGATWTERTLPFTGGGVAVVSIRWANANVGYIALASGTSPIWVTWDGGQSWENTNTSRIVTQPSGSVIRDLIVPCCSNQVGQANNLLVVGELSGAGQVWEGTIYRC